MNMISQLRQQILCMGNAVITPVMFDQLQAEWITRSGAEDLVAAEGLTVLKTMLSVYDITGNPAQFRAALAEAVAKREPNPKK